MKVIIFGATGTIGHLFVEGALADGHSVTAFARNPDKLDIQHPSLSRVGGDAVKRSDVSDAIAGHDAVVVTLGAGMNRKSLIRSQGTKTIIAAMQAHGMKRLICQSTLGAHDSWGNLNFFWKRIMFGLLLKPVFQDHELQEILVRESGLDWTLVRPSAFTNSPVKGRLKIGFDANTTDLALKIPRAVVAAFLRKQLFDKDHIQQAVGLSF